VGIPARQRAPADSRAARSINGGVASGPEVDFMTCRRLPSAALFASVAVGTGTDGGVVAPNPSKSRSELRRPNGLTYYVGR